MLMLVCTVDKDGVPISLPMRDGTVQLYSFYTRACPGNGEKQFAIMDTADAVMLDECREYLNQNGCSRYTLIQWIKETHRNALSSPLGSTLGDRIRGLETEVEGRNREIDFLRKDNKCLNIKIVDYESKLAAQTTAVEAYQQIEDLCAGLGYDIPDHGFDAEGLGKWIEGLFEQLPQAAREAFARLRKCLVQNSNAVAEGVHIADEAVSVIESLRERLSSPTPPPEHNGPGYAEWRWFLDRGYSFTTYQGEDGLNRVTIKMGENEEHTVQTRLSIGYAIQTLLANLKP